MRAGNDNSANDADAVAAASDNDFIDAEDCWVGGHIDFFDVCYCGKYPSSDYPNGACHIHGTCAGGPDCDGTCL